MPQFTVNSRAITPDEVRELFVQPALDLSVATQPEVSTVVSTNATTTRWPLVTADPSAEWTNEGQEINPSQAALEEAVATPRKVAGLVVISNELATDSSPEAAAIVGQGLARDCGRKMDQAFLSIRPAPAPSGLAGLAGVSTVNAPAQWSDLDPFAEALAVAEGVGASTTAFLAHPDDVLALSTVKQGTGSNIALLAPDPTQPARRTILGRPVFPSSYATRGTVWAVDSSRIITALREDATVESSRDAYFSSDQTAVRAVMRVAWAVLHPASVVKIIRATS